jgi:hypothetical protein
MVHNTALATYRKKDIEIKISKIASLTQKRGHDLVS